MEIRAAKAVLMAAPTSKSVRQMEVAPRVLDTVFAEREKDLELALGCKESPVAKEVCGWDFFMILQGHFQPNYHIIYF